eukprot:scaffold44979_cov25-Phaeocystis_antarctica.AAC.2
MPSTCSANSSGPDLRVYYPLPTAHLEREQQPLRLGDGEAGGDGNDAELRHVLVVQQRLRGVVGCGVAAISS